LLPFYYRFDPVQRGWGGNPLMGGRPQGRAAGTCKRPRENRGAGGGPGGPPRAKGLERPERGAAPNWPSPGGD